MGGGVYTGKHIENIKIYEYENIDNYALFYIACVDYMNSIRLYHEIVQQPLVKLYIV